MGKKAPKAPTPVDPTVVANAQAKANKETASYQQQLNMVGSSGPISNVSWQQDGNSPGGYKQVSSFTQPYQSLINQYQKNSSPQAVSNAMYSQAKSRLDPEWSMQDDQIRTQLANQGLTPGGEGYDKAYQNFLRAKNDAYNQANYSSIQAGDESSLQRGALLQGLYGLGQSSVPQYSPVGVAPTDVTGAYGLNAQQQQNQYNAEMQNYQSGLGGLFGLGSAALTAFSGPIGGLFGAAGGALKGNSYGNPAGFVKGWASR